MKVTILALILANLAIGQELRFVGGLSLDSAKSSSTTESTRSFVFGGHAYYNNLLTGIRISNKTLVAEDEFSTDTIKFTLLQVPFLYYHRINESRSLFAGVSLGLITGAKCDVEEKPGVTVEGGDCDEPGLLPTLEFGFDVNINEKVKFIAIYDYLSSSGDSLSSLILGAAFMF